MKTSWLFNGHSVATEEGIFYTEGFGDGEDYLYLYYGQNYNKVDFLCPICNMELIVINFCEDKVTNCKGIEINPCIPSICDDCLKKEQKKLNEMPVWTEGELYLLKKRREIKE